MLESIDGISRVHNLKVLKLKGSGFKWDLNTVNELEGLEHLEILTPEFRDQTLSVTQKFFTSHKVMSCTQSLSMWNLEKSFGISLPGTMDNLRYIIIINCNISAIKMGRKCSFLNLVEVGINVEGLRELTFLMFAPNLRKLHVRSSNEIEDIVNKEKACEVEYSGIYPFSKLKLLELVDLPLLKNIFWYPLPFPCLEVIDIEGCPNLKKLPLDSSSGKNGDNGIIIKCNEKEWIEGVEWEDEATKTRFLSSWIEDQTDLQFRQLRQQVGSW